jgi:2-oxoglutarate dehydrogenase E2 component (dihydrolipoamide succinyltransferase)
MTTNVIMPQLGESVVEGTVSRWLKGVGDAISEYEPLLEVSTDKVDTEIPAPADGVVLRIYVDEGQTVSAGTLLCVIGQPGESAPDGVPAADVSAPAADAPPPASPVPAHAPEPQHSAHVTPVVARMAAEHNLNLAQIAGSGRGGRITKRDVEAHLAAQPTAPADELPPWERPGSGDLFKATVDYEAQTPAPSPTPRPAPARAEPPAAGDELIPLTPLRRAIAEHMVRSKLHTSPHVTTVFEMDMSAALAHQAAQRDAFARQGIKLTLTAYFAAATVAALRARPAFNARWTDDGILMQRAVHLGIAVAVDGGLIVPVVKNAQNMSLEGLARAINDLAARARSRQLQPDEAQGGTFTITNHGVSGSLFATPIINQPQVGILGVGLVEKRVKVIGDAIAIRPCAYVTLTFDHRVTDGADGDAFLQVVKHTLESWPAG